MQYTNIVKGRFIERPNRFIARVKIDGQVETVHVKNTGRCRELLTPEAKVYLVKSDNPKRSTAYDLVAVEKGARLVNMDSQAPNRAVEEWLLRRELFPDLVFVRPETKYGNSRFDFYIETKEQKIFMEVKGVTLEEDGVVRFPDAPSERALRHVEELMQAKKDGYRTFVMFVVQMSDVKYFTPNRETHREFAEALCRAKEAGVEILAYDCLVEPDGMTVRRPVPVRLFDGKTVIDEDNSDIKEILSLGSLKGISRPLLTWYDKNRRILPWREEPTPYRVWVSEIMLQQTRVEAVKPYYDRFMAVLPNIKALAEADEETLLKLWEGLGYYNRARNLQKAAIQIQAQYNGQMPPQYEELLKLTGIGSYTAGAVASIAFGKAVPAVDGNVMRVLSRIRQDERMISDARVKTAVERELMEVIPADRPGDFNQAIMELGACICIPNGAPLCADCPLKASCMAHRTGTEREYPKKRVKRSRTVEERTILVIQDENRTVIHRRKERGLLSGMYEFPSMPGYCTSEEIVRFLAGNGLKALSVRPLGEARHIFTHKEWHMRGYMARVDELEPRGAGGQSEEWLYIEPEEIGEKYPIPSAFGAYTKYLGIKQGKNRMQEDERK